MSSFSLSGGVEVLGFISPTDSLDTYAVIDPLYGVDGFRNVNLLSDLNLIPEPRRRAGMVVGVSGGTDYYKLLPSPWNYTISDWGLFQTGGGSTVFTGGTVSGDTIFTQGLSANTFSATTYLGLPIDVYVTGGTYSDGVTTFTNVTGGTFNVVGYYTGNTDNNQYVTGFTYQDNTFTISDNSGSTFNAIIKTVTGLTVNGVLSATTYQNLPLDVYVTGLTFNTSNYDLTIGRNDGVSFTDSLSILSSDLTVTGGTYNPNSGVATFTNNTGGTFDVSGFITGFTDIYTTGITYSNNEITISDTANNTYSATINTMTGLTVNGVLSATTIGNSGNCVSDLYVSNIRSCSPLNINPLDEGNVYFGSSGVTFDLINNKVGIGTSTPSTIFHVVGNYTGSTDALIPQMLFQNSNTIPNTNKTAIVRTSVGTGYYVGGYPEIWLESQETSAGVGLTKLRTVSNHPLLFYTNDIERGRFGDTGNFGLNTQSPAGMLHVRTGVNKNIIFTSGTTRNLIRSLIDGNSNYVGLEIDTLDLNIKTNGVDRVIINSSGDTGIGTITPTAKVHINNTTSGNTFLAEDDTNPDSSPFVIDASGNTGIGTLTPYAKLDISSNGGRLRLSQNLLGNVFNGIDFVSYVGGVNGSLISNQFTGELRLYTSPTYFPTFYSSGNEVMRISTSGNVGIGTTTPSEKLDVSGKTKTINLQVTSGATTGYVLTSDSSGNATWQQTSTFTGGTVNGITATTISATTYQNLPVTADTFTTGFTYSNNTFTIERNQGLSNLTATINSVTGLTVNGNLTVTGNTSLQDLTATTISATTYQNLPTDITVTGGTYSAGTATFTNNTGGTFNVTGFLTGSTGSSGVWGISNSGGTYTYYSTLSAAMSASTSGQVIEMFADYTETTGNSVALKPGVTLQGNGHTYTHTNTTGNTFTLSTTGTYRFMNLVIKRTVTTPTGAFIFNNPGAPFYQGYTMIFQNTSVEYTWTTSTGATPFIAPSTNVCFYYIDGIRALANGSGTMFGGNGSLVQTIKNSVIENTGTGSCYSSDNITGGSYVENSHLKTNSGTVVTFSYAGQGDSIRNSTVISTSGIGVAGGYAYDTSSFSNTNRAFSGVVCYMCAGSTGSGTVYYQSTAWNSTGVSSTGYVVTPFFTLSSFFNCTFNAVSNIVAYDTTYSAAFYNCTLTTGYNNVAGHAISLAGAGNVLVNCYVAVTNASANCFRGTSAISAKYSNNTFAGATTPVNSNVTQSIVNTQDNQGNILI